MSLSLRCANSGVAVAVLLFPAAPSRIPPAKCGRFHSLRYRIEMVGKVHLNRAERPMCRFELVERYLLTDYIIPYTSAEIPPAGAPSGFDSAAMIGFSVRRCTVVPLRSE